ncbi:hypothetical protein AB0J42_33310 [Nonomuraea sp. NPDC049649]
MQVAHAGNGTSEVTVRISLMYEPEETSRKRGEVGDRLTTSG